MAHINNQQIYTNLGEKKLSCKFHI